MRLLSALSLLSFVINVSRSLDDVQFERIVSAGSRPICKKSRLFNYNIIVLQSFGRSGDRTGRCVTTTGHSDQRRDDLVYKKSLRFAALRCTDCFDKTVLFCVRIEGTFALKMKPLNGKDETSDDESGLGYQNTLVSDFKVICETFYFLEILFVTHLDRQQFPSFDV